jgi:hypothetical protein
MDQATLYIWETYKRHADRMIEFLVLGVFCTHCECYNGTVMMSAFAVTGNSHISVPLNGRRVACRPVIVVDSHER